ncbi:MAG TPA: triose-phosphate isomerase [Nitrososphaeraceae archaeon]|nr:triose-phosphate isomerase [Nitrososphaeraceae archaeon]
MTRLFLINFKNYTEISAERTVSLALAAQKAAKTLNVEIVVAPPQPSIAIVKQNVDIPVFCQHIDDAKAGQSTGFFIPEMAKSYGAAGSIINHSEHRLSYVVISNLVQRLKQLSMTSVVCAQTPKEVAELAKLNPDFIAIEPPELIGSGKAVSKESPKIIQDSIKSAAQSSKYTKLICGAGIVDQSDVTAALQLGVEGILVASGIIKSNSWYEKILELGSAFTMTRL